MSPAEQLRAARLAAGLTQRQAAEVSGISRRTIENWEAGRNAPDRHKREAYLRLIKEGAPCVTQ